MSIGYIMYVGTLIIDTLHCNFHICSSSCLVDLGDSFVLTGDYNYREEGGGNLVTQYNSGGLVQELAPLNTGRYDHGCTAYYTDNQPVILRY